MMHTVLLIGDDDSTRYGLSHAASAANCLLYQYSDPAIAVEAIRFLNPALVFVTLRMGDMDGCVWDFAGLNICRVLREAHGPDLPVLLLTPNDTPAIVKPCLSAGADDYLVQHDEAMARERLARWLPVSQTRRRSEASRPRTTRAPAQTAAVQPPFLSSLNLTAPAQPVLAEVK